jgi:hypothetical protein
MSRRSGAAAKADTRAARINQLRKSSSAASQPSLAFGELRLGRRVSAGEGCLAEAPRRRAWREGGHPGRDFLTPIKPGCPAETAYLCVLCWYASHDYWRFWWSELCHGRFHGRTVHANRLHPAQRKRSIAPLHRRHEQCAGQARVAQLPTLRVYHRLCPWSLVVSIEFSTENAARRFERYLKTGSGRAFSNATSAPFESWLSWAAACPPPSAESRRFARSAAARRRPSGHLASGHRAAAGRRTSGRGSGTLRPAATAACGFWPHPR